MICVLIATAIISGLAGEPVDTIIIFSIVILNALLGFFQESKADKSIRVLGAAYRILDDDVTEITPAAIESKLIFLGLFGLIDPPREEVKTAITECLNAGIRPIMITGDHKNTAVAIAKQLGFFTETSLALSGAEINSLFVELAKGMVRLKTQSSSGHYKKTVASRIPRLLLNHYELYEEFTLSSDQHYGTKDT